MNNTVLSIAACVFTAIGQPIIAVVCIIVMLNSLRSAKV